MQNIDFKGSKKNFHRQEAQRKTSIEKRLKERLP